MDFKLVSDYAPMGDQPEAIGQLVSSSEHGSKHNTLLGVPGSGKTFTVANVIARLNRPTLVLSHNKTLAAQLYGEFRNFFPENAVEYFVSYYDYYQPEAYLPSTDTYIEKDLQINAEIEKMRLGTVATLLSGRRDVIVVSAATSMSSTSWSRRSTPAPNASWSLRRSASTATRWTSWRPSASSATSASA